MLFNHTKILVGDFNKGRDAKKSSSNVKNMTMLFALFAAMLIKDKHSLIHLEIILKSASIKEICGFASRS